MCYHNTMKPRQSKYIYYSEYVQANKKQYELSDHTKYSNCPSNCFDCPNDVVCIHNDTRKKEELPEEKGGSRGECEASNL